MPTTVFVWEYASATADPALPASIRTEGWAMLAAVLADFARVYGVRVTTLLNADAVRRCWDAGLDVLTASNDADFDDLASANDWTLVIAPETEGVLADRCRRVLRAGGRLLGSSPEAVELTADKLRLASHLAAHGVATPSCQSPDAAESGQFPAVLKPRDGAGSQATFLVPDREALPSIVEQAGAEVPEGEFILQPFLAGQAASVAFLVGPRATIPLLPATQELSDDGRFRYRGGRIPLTGTLAERAVELARRAVAAVSGLAGYVGVDLVLGERDAVIEINPRLTTSYVGLRALARFNLAAAMLGLASGSEPVLPAWRDGVVRFEPGGTIHGG
jgi:predicted ATP-grasp superfamily ATP-dependent carboligase